MTSTTCASCGESASPRDVCFTACIDYGSSASTCESTCS
jgi:hypothetical protein